MSQAPAKTFRFRLLHDTDMSSWLTSTKTFFNQIVEFYFGVIDRHQEILKLTTLDALRALEVLTHKTPKTPEPEIPLAAISTLISTAFRRAAINVAIGAARSFYTRLAKWKRDKLEAEESKKKFTDRPPTPPSVWNYNPVFYVEQRKKFNGTSILLKLWTGTSWAWVKFKLSGRKIPTGWKTQSPALVKTGKRWALTIPASKEGFAWPESIEKQLKKSSTKICSVDLNINDDLAVCVIQKADGTVEATKFILGGDCLQHRRKKLFGKAAVKKAETNAAAQTGARNNVSIWSKVKQIDADTAHRVSRRIVDFAVAHRANIIVFEHLGRFKAKKGRYSKAGNSKRHFWLRGKIFKFTEYKAWEHSILISRVSPANTSKRCSECATDVFRYDTEVDVNNAYTPGAPNFLCPACGKRGNANRMAAVNVGRKLFRRYLEKPGEKPSGVLAPYEGESHVSQDGRGTSQNVRR